MSALGILNAQNQCKGIVKESKQKTSKTMAQSVVVKKQAESYLLGYTPCLVQAKKYPTQNASVKPLQTPTPRKAWGFGQATEGQWGKEEKANCLCIQRDAHRERACCEHNRLCFLGRDAISWAKWKLQMFRTLQSSYHPDILERNTHMYYIAEAAKMCNDQLRTSGSVLSS